MSIKKLLVLIFCGLSIGINATEQSSSFECVSDVSDNRLTLFLMKDRAEIKFLVVNDQDNLILYKPISEASGQFTYWTKPEESHGDIWAYSSILLLAKQDLESAYEDKSFVIRRMKKGVNRGEILSCRLIK